MKTLSQLHAEQVDIENRLSYWINLRQTAKTIEDSTHADGHCAHLQVLWREVARQIELVLNSQVAN